jgi:hypothetical protein
MKRLLCLVPLVACGDDGAIPIDAPVDSSSIDAPIDGPPTPGTVSLTIRDGGAGVEGVDVYFQQPDGSLAAKVATDASGVATATVQTGGWVTVVDPFDGSAPGVRGLAHAEIKTFAGVKPGDELLIEEPAYAFISVDVTLPTITNGDAWEVWTTCGNDLFVSTASELALFCTGATDFTVVALDDTGAPIGFFYEPNVLLSDGATIDLSTETYAAVGDASFAYASVPTAFDRVEVFNGIASPRGVSYQLETGGDLTGGAATILQARPSPANTTAFVESTFGEVEPTANEHIAISWGPSATTTATTFDGTNKFLPSFTGDPTFDPATRQLAWTSTTTTAQPDFVKARFEGIRNEPLAAWYWDIVAPYNGTSVTFPVLPTGIELFNALATDFTEVRELKTAKLSGGYDAIREQLFVQGLGNRSDGWGPVPQSASGEGQAVSWTPDFGPVVRVRPTPSRFDVNTAAAKTAKLAAKKAALKAAKAKATKRTR